MFRTVPGNFENENWFVTPALVTAEDGSDIRLSGAGDGPDALGGGPIEDAAPRWRYRKATDRQGAGLADRTGEARNRCRASVAGRSRSTLRFPTIIPTIGLSRVISGGIPLVFSRGLGERLPVCRVGEGMP